MRILGLSDQEFLKAVGITLIIILLMLTQNTGMGLLNLMGPVEEQYKQFLKSLSPNENVVRFIPEVAYKEIPGKTHQFDVGLAIHLPKSIMYSTGSTASTKIYEYAASGLPVILFDHKAYREKLDKYNWTFFTNLENMNFIEILSQIINSFTILSNSAITDFVNGLNFETAFANQVKEYL